MPAIPPKADINRRIVDVRFVPKADIARARTSGWGTLVPLICFDEMQQSNVGERVRACLKKAAECERQALLATDETNRKTYLELAHLWRDMAQQAEALHRQSSTL